eukprot:3945570-Karenia_brevis.AAC.1
MPRLNCSARGPSHPQDAATWQPWETSSGDSSGTRCSVQEGVIRRQNLRSASAPAISGRGK